jgi:hypothetical protein
MEELKSHVILKDTSTKIDMDYIANLGELIDVFERQLLHFVKSQTPFCLKNLLSLPHLPAKKTCEKEPLVDYIQSHVVTSHKYLQILHKKTMDREAIEIIK